MSTRLVLSIQAPNGEGSAELFVTEDFDEVLNHVCPLQPPSSQLENRGLITYHKSGSYDRILLTPQMIAWAEENVEPKND